MADYPVDFGHFLLNSLIVICGPEFFRVLASVHFEENGGSFPFPESEEDVIELGNEASYLTKCHFYHYSPPVLSDMKVCSLKNGWTRQMTRQIHGK